MNITVDAPDNNQCNCAGCQGPRGEHNPGRCRLRAIVIRDGARWCGRCYFNQYEHTSTAPQDWRPFGDRKHKET